MNFCRKIYIFTFSPRFFLYAALIKNPFQKEAKTKADKKSAVLHAKAKPNLIFCRMNSGAVIRYDTCVLFPLNHHVHGAKGEKNRFQVR